MQVGDQRSDQARTAFDEAPRDSEIVAPPRSRPSRGGLTRQEVTIGALRDDHLVGASVPVRFVGVGEGARDLLPFDPDAFVQALFA